MDKTGRLAAAAVTGRPIAVAAAVAVGVAVGVAVAVGVTVTLDRGAPAPVGARADPATLYGRWVLSGDACDTRRGDMLIDAGAITNREGGVQRSKMKLAAVARKSPDSFEVKYTSFNGEFVDFATFQLKDSATLVVSRYLFYPDGVWRKCPA